MCIKINCADKLQIDAMIGADCLLSDVVAQIIIILYSQCLTASH